MKFLHSLLTLSQFSLQASQFASWTVFRTFRSRCILIEYTAKPESLHSEKVNIIISQFQCCWLRLPPHLPHVFMQFIFIHLLLWQLFQYFEQSKQNYTEHKVGPGRVMCHVYLFQAPEANFGTPMSPFWTQGDEKNVQPRFLGLITAGGAGRYLKDLSPDIPRDITEKLVTTKWNFRKP